MITIRPDNNKHRILFSSPGTGDRGLSVLANNITEVHEAIDHWFARDHNKAECPLCRNIAQREHATASEL